MITGCTRSESGIITSEARETKIPDTQSVTVPASTSSATRVDVYPAPSTETPVKLTQDSIEYPAPPETTKPVSNPDPTPILPGGENNALNPYPLLGTSIPQQAGSANPSPYPPPVIGAPGPTITVSVPTPRPVGRGAALPTSQSTASATVTTGLTPTATTVKTRFLPTDPTTFSLEAGRPQLVVFYADWCTLCKSIAPVVLGLESKYRDRLNFIYLDVDDRRTIPVQDSLKYRLSSRPRIYLIDGAGLTLRDWAGYVLLEELEEAIGSAIPVSP